MENLCINEPVFVCFFLGLSVNIHRDAAPHCTVAILCSTEKLAPRCTGLATQLWLHSSEMSSAVEQGGVGRRWLDVGGEVELAGALSLVNAVAVEVRLGVEVVVGGHLLVQAEVLHPHRLQEEETVGRQGGGLFY